jgi:hypothetical protein
MMEQVGVRLADLGGDGLERHRLRPFLDQQRARRLDCGQAAVVLVEAFANY